MTVIYPAADPSNIDIRGILVTHAELHQDFINT